MGKNLVYNIYVNILDSLPILKYLNFDVNYIYSLSRSLSSCLSFTKLSVEDCLFSRWYTKDIHPKRTSCWLLCRIWSLQHKPMSYLESMHFITHSCSGGMFDNLHSFEHDFFPQISRSCPLLSRLTLLNKIKQKFKQSQQLTKSKASSIIEDPP